MKSSFPRGTVLSREYLTVTRTIFGIFCFEAVGGDLMTFQTINSAERSY